MPPSAARQATAPSEGPQGERTDCGSGTWDGGGLTKTAGAMHVSIYLSTCVHVSACTRPEVEHIVFRCAQLLICMLKTLIPQINALLCLAVLSCSSALWSLPRFKTLP